MGILKGKDQKPIIVNGMPDHIHAFVGLKPSMAISDLVRDIKNNASNFINDHKFIKGKFTWQEGYGAFSYSHSHIGRVYDYILNQEKHYQKKTFKQEYLSFLKKFEVDYDEKYLFEWYDQNPVQEGFVTRAEDWKYSSARDFCRMKGLVELNYS